MQKTLHLGALLLATQYGRSEYAREERSGLLVLPSASCSATPRRSRPKPQQPDLLAPRKASMLRFCPPRASLLTASLRKQQAQAPVPPLHHLWCFRPVRSYALLRGTIIIRTCDKHKNQYNPLFLLAICGPDYYVPR